MSLKSRKNPRKKCTACKGSGRRMRSKGHYLSWNCDELTCSPCSGTDFQGGKI